MTSRGRLGRSRFRFYVDCVLLLAKQLNDTHGLVVDLVWAAVLGYCERNPAEVERLASEVIELSTRHHFAHCT
jgi:hypothetical protein